MKGQDLLFPPSSAAQDGQSVLIVGMNLVTCSLFQSTCLLGASPLLRPPTALNPFPLGRHQ